MVVIILKMLWHSEISELDVGSDAYQKPNRGLMDAGFRKWDNRVRLVMAALPLFYFIVEKALPPPHFVDCTMSFHNDQLPSSTHLKETPTTQPLTFPVVSFHSHSSCCHDLPLQQTSLPCLY